MFIQPSEIELHLSFEGRFKATQFQFDRHQPFEGSMIEQQVQIVISTSNRHALLSGDETEVAAQFEKESFQFFQNGTLKILFGSSVTGSRA
jgi:hypothetical protein